MLRRKSYRQSQYYYAPTTILLHAQRGRSRAQHVRYREADIERAKNGAWCICDAPKARPAGPSLHLGCVFMQRHRKRRMARPEGPILCFRYCSFVEERGSSGEARAYGPTSPFLVASDQKCQILALVVLP